MIVPCSYARHTIVTVGYSHELTQSLHTTFIACSAAVRLATHGRYQVELSSGASGHLLERLGVTEQMNDTSVSGPRTYGHGPLTLTSVSFSGRRLGTILAHASARNSNQFGPLSRHVTALVTPPRDAMFLPRGRAGGFWAFVTPSQHFGTFGIRIFPHSAEACARKRENRTPIKSGVTGVTA
jgi:hypothetical protein